MPTKIDDLYKQIVDHHKSIAQLKLKYYQALHYPDNHRYTDLEDKAQRYSLIERLHAILTHDEYFKSSGARFDFSTSISQHIFINDELHEVSLTSVGVCLHNDGTGYFIHEDGELSITKL